MEALQESLTKDVQGVQCARLLAVMGPSGSDKSSVVMAGLLPYLQQGRLPGSKDWVYLDPLVPGKHPLEALASTLKPHFPDTSFKTLREDLEDEATRGMHLLASHVAKRPETCVFVNDTSASIGSLRQCLFDVIPSFDPNAIIPSWLWRASRRIVTHNHYHKDL